MSFILETRIQFRVSKTPHRHAAHSGYIVCERSEVLSSQ